MTVLSTKRLNPADSRHLLHAGLSLVQYDAISIKPVDISPGRDELKNVIVTSKNALPAIRGVKTQIGQVFCVGHKTAAACTKIGLRVWLKAKTAEDLAIMIIRQYPDRRFTYLCSSKRRPELPDLLGQSNVTLKEITAYRTYLVKRRWNRTFAMIMFFSPSCVQSYTESHTGLDYQKKAMAICIGPTTARSAERYFYKTMIAERTTVTSTVIKAIKTAETL